MPYIASALATDMEPRSTRRAVRLSPYGGAVCMPCVAHVLLTLDDDKLHTTHVHGAEQQEDEPRREDADVAQPAHKCRIHEGVQGVPMPEVRVLAAADPGLWELSWLKGTVINLHKTHTPLYAQPLAWSEKQLMGLDVRNAMQVELPCLLRHSELYKEACKWHGVPTGCMLGLPGPGANSGDASEPAAWFPGRSPMQTLALSETALFTGAQLFSSICPVALLALRLIGRAS